MRSVAGRCDLSVGGEAFVHGFDALTDDPSHDLAAGWTPAAPRMAQVRDWARELDPSVCPGLVERHGGHLHSSAVLVGVCAQCAASGAGRWVGAPARPLSGW